METYTILREFADSWFLLVMFAFFVGVAIWAFWPSQRAARDEAASIPFRDDRESGCQGNCKDCEQARKISQEVNNV